MAKVGNLKIALQSGTDSTYYATWTFDENLKTTSSSGSIKAGDLVSIKAGATWYNGVAIPNWVYSYKWYVTQVNGNRAVLGKNEGGSNNIVSPIHTKYLTGGSGSSTTTSGTTKTLDHYKVEWRYHTGDSVWFSANSSDVTEKQDVYGSPPENATKIKVTVTPVSKTYKVGDTDKTYWSGTAASYEFNLTTTAAAKPTSAPSVEIKDYTLTAEVNGINDVRTDEIQFQVYNGKTLFKTGTVTVQMQRAKYSCTIKAGGKYTVRYRAANILSGGKSRVYSDWSPYSDEKSTAPASVTNVKCSADSKTSVKLTWSAAPTATGYTIEYATKDIYFDTSTQVSSTSVKETTAYISGLESGQKWYFRVKATNDEGDSGWSSIVSTIIGTTPEAPTTWSLTNTVIVGDDITLYWVHNSEDGSKQTEAQIQLDINGLVSTVEVPGIVDEDEDEPIYSYTFSSSGYSEGAKILWKVRTKGITSEYSEWSTQRTIDLYAPPFVELLVATDDDGVLRSLPLDITISAGPVAQSPTSYHISIKNVDAYESTDAIGSDILVSANTELFSRIYMVTDREFSVSLSAGDIMLSDSQNYELTVTASMNSGLTAEATVPFSVSWDTYEYIPDASIAIDRDTLTAYITPYCSDNEDNLIGDVTMSVYRRESNGTFTELITGLANTGVDTITDPHPSLDFARYRIVAQNVHTGGVSYEDIPGYPVNEPSIVIQWDEKWVNFDYTEEAEPETPPWTGSMVRLPYNVDINERYAGDVSLVNYIGREHPVSYYGTHRGESATWSTDIQKSDKETLYALRRLAAWRGDVYVREPTGTGYWAQVTVSFPINHLEMTVPVTFEINRVEGGV